VEDMTETFLCVFSVHSVVWDWQQEGIKERCEWEGNGNKTWLSLGSGMGMGMNQWEWEGSELKKTFPLTSTSVTLSSNCYCEQTKLLQNVHAAQWLKIPSTTCDDKSHESGKTRQKNISFITCHSLTSMNRDQTVYPQKLPWFLKIIILSSVVYESVVLLLVRKPCR